MDTLQLIIGGQFVPAGSGQTRDIECPANREVHLRAAEASAQDVAAAIASARAEFDSGAWRQTTVGERAQILRRVADRLEADKDEIARAVDLRV